MSANMAGAKGKLCFKKNKEKLTEQSKEKTKEK